MTASAEALGLVATVANSERFRVRLEELSRKQAEAEAAVANLNAVSKASGDKLQTEAVLLEELTAQVVAIKTSQDAAEQKLEETRAGLAQREASLEAAEKAHVDRVARDLQNLESRESELRAKQAAADADFANRSKELDGTANKLNDHHVGLRAIINETQARIAAAS